MRLLPLISIILAGLIIRRSIKKTDKERSVGLNSFWERERASYASVSEKIDESEWIHIPERLPLNIITDDEQIKEYQQTLKNLSNLSIMNLTGLSNTDIRIKYGAVNFSKLSRADERFTLMSRTLVRLSNKYLELGLKDEAIELLEFGILSGSDVTENFTLLQGLYAESDSSDLKRLDLVMFAEKLNSFSKRAILRRLKEDGKKD